MLQKLFVLCSIYCLSQNVASQSLVNKVPGFDTQECSLKHENIRVNIGWPYRFQFSGYRLSPRQLKNEGRFTSKNLYKFRLLRGSDNQVLYNVTVSPSTVRSVYYDTEDLSDKEELYYIIESGAVNFTTCDVIHIRFNLTTQPELSCSESIQEEVTNWSQAKYDGSKTLQCEDIKGEHRLRLDANKHNYSTEWLYNCSKTLPNHTLVQLTNQIGTNYFSHELFIPNFDLDHAGVYTCVVKYNGKINYVINRAFCVKVKDATESPIVNCDKTIYFIKTIGQNVTINCTVHYGYGQISPLASANWNKTDNNNFECYTLLPGQQPADGNTSHSCSREDNEPEDICFKNPPSKEELRPVAAVSQVQLQLRDIQKQDLGRYTLQITSSQNIKIYYDVTIQLDQKPILKSSAAMMGGVLGGIIFILILLLLCYLLRFYFKLAYKKYLAPYQNDDKEYGALLSYHYSKEIDTFAQKQVGKTCAAVRDQLEGLGYSVYDEHKDGIDGFRAGGSVSLMGVSHRVFVILTADYVRDNWSVFQLQQGFKQMIECGSKIIFILTPGMREYIKQQSIKDNTYRMIRRALKINHAISWPCESRCFPRKLRWQIEHVMPKLKDLDKNISRSSSYEVGFHPNGVDRILSNTTNITELSYDGSYFNKV